MWQWAKLGGFTMILHDHHIKVSTNFNKKRLALLIKASMEISSAWRENMAGKTSIEWSEYTWNPATGCQEVSPGCDHCYAKRFAERFRGVPGNPYEQGFDLKLW